MTDKHLVRATIEPGVVREVSGAELLDLARMGLIHSYEKTDAAAVVLDGTAFKGGPKWKPAEKKGDVVTAPPATGATAPADNDTKGE